MKNQLSLEAFADWCEKKPANEEYFWTDADICACGQYAASLGLQGNWPLKKDTFWFDANMIALLTMPHTFGALARRLCEAIAKEAQDAKAS